MKAKNQQIFTSESDAKEKLIVYVYEYLVHSGAKQAADIFKDNIGYTKEIKINDGPGFLLDWWCVFWDLYCAAPERRHSQPESSGEARAFHDFMRSTPISPSITQTSPPQHPQQPPPPQFMSGPRYGPPPQSHGQVRGPMPRLSTPMQQHGPHTGGPNSSSFMPTNNPRYAQHPGPPQPMVNQGSMFGPMPDQICSSPGLNRTPVGGPTQTIIGYPNTGPQTQMVVGEPPAPHQDEYVMPVTYGQDTNDQCESVEIMKLKQSMQDDTAKMFEKEQSEFSLGDYSDSQGKWN